MEPAMFPNPFLIWTLECVTVVLGEGHEMGFYESSSPVAWPLGTAWSGRRAGRRQRRGSPGSRDEPCGWRAGQRGCVTHPSGPLRERERLFTAVRDRPFVFTSDCAT